MKCEVIIDASVEEVAAFNFLFVSRRILRRVDKANTSTLIYETLANSNHSFDYHTARDLGVALKPRRWLSRQIWRKYENGSMIHAFYDIESSKLLSKEEKAKQNYVAASSSGYYLYEPVDDGASCS